MNFQAQSEDSSLNNMIFFSKAVCRIDFYQSQEGK